MRLLTLTVAFAILGLGFLSFMIELPEPETGLKNGDEAPGINAKLLDGRDFSLENMKGKMVLIDFWASYNASSRIENHEKITLLEKYQDLKFENGEGFYIVSISLDRFKSPLDRAINADRLSYQYHICDYNGRESSIVKAYNASELNKYLIDGEGRIVAMNNSLSPISEELDKLIKK
jgi:peroxiredoxin